ncbi:MAG: hypothetical protein KAW47_11205 [Thermoplasmatales archaeon]|nr:hypothetical protein [Thermoplasmatales archaeon]
MIFEKTNEIDIKAYLVMGLALLFAWFGMISWTIAILFIVSSCTFKLKMWRKK